MNALVWTPKYRRAVLVGRVAALLRRILEQTAFENGWRIHELNIQPDHVHLLLQSEPSLSLAAVMQSLKGISSFRLRREFPELATRSPLWGEGYFAESVGRIEEDAIRRYIREQPAKDQSLPQD